MSEDTRRRILGIGSAIVLMLAAVLILGPALPPEGEAIPHPPAVRAEPQNPIPAEADVFATDARGLAVAPAAEASRPARRRTLAAARTLRAYPGAPPRIPHELAPDEFRLTECSTCHERGGYAPRFRAYTPVTPHPRYENCLQCHVASETAGTFVGLDWRPAAWPPLGERAMEGAPPRIPHDLQLRGNCLACHGGPGAVEEIRTTHPERVNCRQCHVPSDPEAIAPVFTRPMEADAREGGGGP